MIYTLCFFLSSKRCLFHNSNVFGSCIIHILYTGCAKIKKNNSGSKRLNILIFSVQNLFLGYEYSTRLAGLPHNTAQKLADIYWRP